MTQANDERAARKQYIRRRQKVVFTITGTILTIALVISLLFFFHVGGSVSYTHLTLPTIYSV